MCLLEKLLINIGLSHTFSFICSRCLHIINNLQTQRILVIYTHCCIEIILKEEINKLNMMSLSSSGKINNNYTILCDKKLKCN